MPYHILQDPNIFNQNISTFVLIFSLKFFSGNISFKDCTRTYFWKATSYRYGRIALFVDFQIFETKVSSSGFHDFVLTSIRLITSPFFSMMSALTNILPTRKAASAIFTFSWLYSSFSVWQHQPAPASWYYLLLQFHNKALQTLPPGNHPQQRPQKLIIDILIGITILIVCIVQPPRTLQGHRKGWFGEVFRHFYLY